MVTVNDILKIQNYRNKDKKLSFSCFTKEYTLQQLVISDSILNYAKVEYSNEGLELCESSKENASTLEDLINLICTRNIPNDENLIMWGECCELINFDSIISYVNDALVFV